MNANAKLVGGWIDWVQVVIDKVKTLDLPKLLAAATALYQTCVDALADKKLNWLEVAAIGSKVLALMLALQIAGVEV